MKTRTILCLVVPARNSRSILLAPGHHWAGVWGEAPGLRAKASRSTPCVRYLEGSAPGGVQAPARLRVGRQRGFAPLAVHLAGNSLIQVFQARCTS